MRITAIGGIENPPSLSVSSKFCSVRLCIAIRSPHSSMLAACMSHSKKWKNCRFSSVLCFFFVFLINFVKGVDFFVGFIYTFITHIHCRIGKRPIGHSLMHCFVCVIRSCRGFIRNCRKYIGRATSFFIVKYQNQ